MYCRVTVPEALKGTVSVVESMRSGPVRSREVARVTADQVPSVLVVSPTLDVSSTADFLEKMKVRPGGANFGSAGMGSTGHLGGTLLSMQTALKAQHVPYRGSAPMLQDLLAGNIQFTIDTVPGLMSFITSGTIKALAITAR